MTPARRHKGEGGMYQRASDGRWVGVVDVGIVGGKRTRRTVTARTRRELAPKLDRLKREVAAGVSGDAFTVRQWLDHWHTQAARDLAPRTWEVYRSYLDQYVIPTVGHHRLTDIRASHVRGMLDWLDEQGRSAATRRQAYSILRRALQVAYDEQRVMENVAARIRRPRPEKRHHAALTIPQARALLDATPSSADRARWLLALHVGLRQGEALGLVWADVHLEGPLPWLLVHQQVQRIAGRGLMVKVGTKSGPGRRVLLTHALGHVADELRRHRSEHGGVGFVFGGASPVSPRRDYGLWQEALTVAGLPMLPLHGARSTARDYLDEQGVPPRTISDVLGHATTTITDTVYHRVTMENLAVQMEKSQAALD